MDEATAKSLERFLRLENDEDFVDDTDFINDYPEYDDDVLRLARRFAGLMDDTPLCPALLVAEGFSLMDDGENWVHGTMELFVTQHNGERWLVYISGASHMDAVKTLGQFRTLVLFHEMKGESA